jgi:hypothetical protein
MMTGETDHAGRDAWIASLDKVAALNPKIVVAGHKQVGARDLPESIGASQQYLRDFSRIVDQGGSVEQIVQEMLELHGDRDNPRTRPRRHPQNGRSRRSQSRGPAHRHGL